MDSMCAPVCIDGRQYFFYAQMDDAHQCLRLEVVNDNERYQETFMLTYESSRIEKRFERRGMRGGDIVLPGIIARHIEGLRKIVAGELIPPLEEIALAERQV